MAKIEPLYLTESEIAAKVGLTLGDWTDTVPALEKYGFPPRDPLFKNRRYWPACRAFLDRFNDVSAEFLSRSKEAAIAKERW